MNYDNYTIKVEIELAIKKIHVLGLITFRKCSTLQKIQKSNFETKNHRNYSNSNKIQKSEFWDKNF